MTELAISPHFSDEEQGVIREEAGLWFAAAPELEVPVLVGHGDHGSIIMGSPNHRKAPCKDNLGVTELRANRAPVVGICINSDDMERFRLVVRHELGHAFGRADSHLADGNAMATTPQGMSDGITERDVQYATTGY